MPMLAAPFGCQALGKELSKEERWGTWVARTYKLPMQSPGKILTVALETSDWVSFLSSWALEHE